jgi:hypothetical protein
MDGPNSIPTIQIRVISFLTDIAWVEGHKFVERPLIGKMLIPAELVEIVELSKPLRWKKRWWKRLWHFITRNSEVAANCRPLNVFRGKCNLSTLADSNVPKVVTPMK